MRHLGEIIEIKEILDDISPGLYKIIAVTCDENPKYILEESMEENNSLPKKEMILVNKIDQRKSLKLPIVIKNRKHRKQFKYQKTEQYNEKENIIEYIGEW